MYRPGSPIGAHSAPDYTFTRAVDTDAEIELLRRPKEKWSANVIWNPIDPLTLSATLLHLGSFVDASRD